MGSNWCELKMVYAPRIQIEREIIDIFACLWFQLQFTTDRVGANVLIFERTSDRPTKETEPEKPTSNNAFNPPRVPEKNEL